MANDLMIQVPYKVLRPVLEALNSTMTHRIREMQATRGLPGFDNEIDDLVNLFNEQVEKYNEWQKSSSVQKQ